MGLSGATVLYNVTLVDDGKGRLNRMLYIELGLLELGFILFGWLESPLLDY